MPMNNLRSYYGKLPPSARIRIKSLFPEDFLRWYARRNTDVYMISYPKCGRTWLRMMVGRAISVHFSLPDDEDVLFLRWDTKNHPDLPKIAVIHDDRPMLKTPQELSTSKKKYKNKDVIFLVRDPRDVIVSSYFEKKKRGDLFGENPYESRASSFEGSLDEFIAQKVGGFETILAYYNIWAQNRSVPKGFLLVRYEDVHANARHELGRVLKFLGLEEIGQNTIKQSVEFSSFKSMRRMESEGKFQTGILNPADETDQESYKTRKGVVGGFKEYLTANQIDALNEKMQSTLSDFFGYNV